MLYVFESIDCPLFGTKRMLKLHFLFYSIQSRQQNVALFDDAQQKVFRVTKKERFTTQQEFLFHSGHISQIPLFFILETQNIQHTRNSVNHAYDSTANVQVIGKDMIMLTEISLNVLIVAIQYLLVGELQFLCTIRSDQNILIHSSDIFFLYRHYR